MKTMMILPALALALISCNKTEKGTATSSQAEQSLSSAVQISSATAPDSTTFHLYGPEKKAPLWSYCAKYTGSDLKSFKAFFESQKTLDGGEQEWGGACDGANRIGECKGVPLVEGSAEKGDIIYSGAGMGAEMDASTITSFSDRCKEMKGTWVK